jgi:hypothetical protein
VEDDWTGDENPHSITSPRHTRGLALSDSEIAEALADSLEAQFQPVNYPSVPAVIEVVNEAMRAHAFEPASEPKLNNLTVIHTKLT